MKNKLVLILVFLLSTCMFNSYAQDPCKVLVHEISENYTGSCKNGLAHGKGIALGIDKYQGNFRNGFPHGVGVYKWANGDEYNGRWRNGKRHGKGVFAFKENDELKILSGIWQNDEFLRKEKIAPYTRGHILNLDRFSVDRKDAGNKVMVTFYYMGRMAQWPADFDFRMETGMTKSEGYSQGYEEVKFPAYILIRYTVPDKLGRGLAIPIRFEITINEPGTWEIKLYN